MSLEGFLARLKDDKSESALLLEPFIDDIKNKSLEEVYNKYYASNKEDFPCVSDLAIIFSQNDENFSIQEIFDKETGELKEKIHESITPSPMNRDSLMRLVANKKMKKHTELDCYVVTPSEFKDILSYASQLQGNCRFQFLVRSDAHYTAVDVEIKAGKMRAAVMDAGGDPSCLELVKALKSANGSPVYLLGALDAIQSDRYNCSFFSMDTVVKSSKDPKFFDSLKPVQEAGGISLVRWDSLPPRFVKNATSTTYLAKYFEKHSETKTQHYKKEQTFEQTIKGHIAKRDVKGTLRDTNTMIEKKIEKYAEVSSKALASLSNAELRSIVKQPALSEFIKRHPLVLP